MPAMPAPPPPTPRTRVRRHPERARYDLAVVNQILDQGLICHLGFVEDGFPFVVPTMYARAGDLLYLHGSPASRMLKRAGSGAEVCVTVTLLDGLVLARSAFNHSMNYRSVMLLGKAEPVDAVPEKMAAFQALVEHVVPGRWQSIRPTTPKELKATAVLRMVIREASCKLRAGGPEDPRQDAELPVWAGVIPIQTTAGRAIPALDLAPGVGLPDHVSGYRR